MILKKKKILARCPGSCGELIQGILLEGEKLISYPINCYSYVKIEEGHQNNKAYYPKAYLALEKVLDYFGEDPTLAEKLRIEIQSEIPKGKGMASSTADLGATLLAATKYLEKEISPEEMAELCLEIEPTDSILFPQLTLFDHIKGQYKKNYQKQLNCKVLVLEGRQVIDTLEFHKIDRKSILEENASQMNQAIQRIEIGIEKEDLREIGQGAILSALANEKILKKPGLEKIIPRALNLGAYGINIAHSGSVVGVLFHEKYFDKEAFLGELKEKNFCKDYIRIKEYSTVKGGAEIIDMEE